MSAELRIKTRKATNTDGSPGGVGNIGNLAANASTASIAANNGAPKLFLSDGTQWLLVNPPAAAPTVGVAPLPGGTPGSSTGINGVWTAFATKPTDPIIIATFAGSAYLKTGTAGNDGDWTALGSAAKFASAAEILAGAVTDKGIAPDQLRAHALAASTGGTSPAAGDANHLVILDSAGQFAAAFIPNATATETLAGVLDTKFITPADLQSRTKKTPSGAGGAAAGADENYLVTLNANGQIDAGFLSIKGLTYRGNLNLTVPYNAITGLKTGDFGTVQTRGKSDGSWTGIAANTQLEVGDLVFWDGLAWHLVERGIDTSAYVAKSGANAIQADMAMTWAAPAALTTVIDGGDATKSRIDNVLLDCGTY